MPTLMLIDFFFLGTDTDRRFGLAYVTNTMVEMRKNRRFLPN